MKIAAWNLNNRVGKVPFRLEAAAAAIAIDADIYVFNEYYPQSQGQAFRAELERAGWVHQALSVETAEKTNRVLIASRLPIAPLPLRMPSFDQQFQANLVGVKILNCDISLLGLRMPWYKSKALVTCAWDWVEETAASLIAQPSIIIGDLNATEQSSAGRGGEHFRRIIQFGWQRATPSGSSYFGRDGKTSTIDHLLTTNECLVESSQYITQINEYNVAGQKGGISDHAILIGKIKINL
jgi:hypothetical protein